jgi:hypothetical protein
MLIVVLLIVVEGYVESGLLLEIFKQAGEGLPRTRNTLAYFMSGSHVSGWPSSSSIRTSWSAASTSPTGIRPGISVIKLSCLVSVADTSTLI